MMSIFFCVALDIIIYPVPVFTPFPGERGQGDRDNKSEVDFKNRLFLQSGGGACPSRNIIHLSQNIR
jgi:hypothetical protein